MQDAWHDFVGGKWEREINVRDFIQSNYTPYDGDESFLAGPTEVTTKLWDQVMDLFEQERQHNGVLDMDT
ncbi:MAG: formate acetyltransferase, partial [Atopobium minutum]|nr:formate acetyltransferase [Atopobium minutum]